MCIPPGFFLLLGTSRIQHLFPFVVENVPLFDWGCEKPQDFKFLNVFKSPAGVPYTHFF